MTETKSLEGVAESIELQSEYERLRNLGFRLNTPLAALAREGIALVLKKHKTNDPEGSNVI